MLHGQRKKVVERGRFVSIGGGAVREAGKQLVFPGLGVPGPGRGIGKFLELPADAAHVGGRPHDDGVSGTQRFPAAVRQIAVGINGDEFGTSAFGYGLRHALGMAVAGVVNHGDGGHFFSHWDGGGVHYAPRLLPSKLQAPGPQAAIVNSPPTTAMFLKNDCCCCMTSSAGTAQKL